MKILHLITSLKIGGAESALVNFLRNANHKPHEHIVAYFHDGPNVERLAHLGIATHHIKGLLTYSDPLGLWRLIRLIKQTKPDLIHSALWSANIIGRLIAHYFSLPIVCDIHGNSYDEGKMRNWADRATVAYATQLVAVSPSTHKAYAENILAIKKHQPHQTKLVTINNGIDYQAVRAQAYHAPLTRHMFGLNDHDFVIGALGRLEPIKSYDILLKAFAQIAHPKGKLVIVGGGSQEHALKKLSSHLGITNKVIFTGFRTDAVSFYPLFDCFVLSSQSEGLSIALLEALCFGIPIITTNLTPQHDVITHRVHGLIVPPNDVHALYQALNFLIENTAVQLAMHTACIERAEHAYALSSTIEAYHSVYTNACENIFKNLNVN